MFFQLMIIAVTRGYFMEHYCSFDKINGKSYIVVSNESVIEVSESFARMTEYSADDFLHKNIKEFLEILRIGPNFDIESIDGDKDYFIFTKTLDVRFVKIGMTGNGLEKIYVFSEEPNSRPDVKFSAIEALCSHNKFGVAVYNTPDITLLKANQTYLNFLDKPFNNRENSIGKKIYEIISGWVGSSSEDIWRNVLSTQKPFYSDEYMFEFDRGITYWEASLTPVFENGILKYCIEITTDITEKVLNRKKIEEQAKVIEQQKRELEIILDNMTDGVVVADKDGRLLKLNTEGKRLLYQIETTSVLGETFKTTRYLDSEFKDIPYENMPLPRSLNGEKVKNSRIIIRRPDKELIADVDASPIYDTDGNIVMTVGIFRDVTEQVQKDATIRKQKELLESIVDNSPDNLSVIDSVGKYLFFKNHLVQDIGVEFDSIDDFYAAAKFCDSSGNEFAQDRQVGYRVLNGETVKNEIITIKGEEQEYYVLSNAKPIYDSDGKFLYGISYTRNVTEHIKSQQALQETQEKLLKSEREKNEALQRSMMMKDEFLSLISHEFKTPINVINMAIQTLNVVYKDQMTDKVKSYIGTIKQNANRQLRLVNNLLDITRANAGRIKVHKSNLDIVFLTKAITESVYEFASKKKVQMTFVSKLAKKVIGVDDEKYERILLNLLSNAIKFTPEGGSIVVSLHSLKGKICVEVTDSGIGIPSEKIDIIFERFGQVDSSLSRQAEGTGIGLSLVKKFVEALGGVISVKSKVGKGTTFKVLLLDQTVIEESNEKPMFNLMDDNRLIQTMDVEFSDIYL